MLYRGHSLPYKDPERQRRAMREIMKKQRAEKKAIKEALRRNGKAMEQLRKIPSAYELIFGKKTQRRRQRKK